MVLGQTAGAVDLLWICALLLMMLCWFRAATVAGLRAGDVQFVANGSLLVTVWEVKGRPEFRTQLGLVEIPANI